MLLLTCVVNCTAGTPMPRPCPVVQWSVHWAPSWTTRVLVLAGARHCALETCGKKNASSTWLNLYIIWGNFLTIVIYEDCIGLSNSYQWVLYQILLLDVIISVGANRRDTRDSFFYLVFVTKWLHFQSYPEPVAGIPYKNRKEIITQILNLKLSNTCHVANGISHSHNMT